MPEPVFATPSRSPFLKLDHLQVFQANNQGDRPHNLCLTSPVLSGSDQTAKLTTCTVWLANHSTPTDTTLRGL
ncbi:MAG TPA: hypothetical protein IGS53_08815 [Leptolyngbyaceae cyanobacterium M33_DOE_097]|nr:hypothetical protein [Leptolyngbyaceae cyanobacterium M33_DOE_097]